VIKQPLPPWELLRHHRGERTQQTHQGNHLQTFHHETSNVPVLRKSDQLGFAEMIVILKENLYSRNAFPATLVPWEADARAGAESTENEQPNARS
jgi:hypothetical protein